MTPNQSARWIDYRSSFTPVYYFCGSRPLIFDLDASDSGRMDAILLNRDGDCALLPLQTIVSNADKQPRREQTDNDAIAITLADLSRNGWDNFGRITITFNGTTNAER